MNCTITKSKSDFRGQYHIALFAGGPKCPSSFTYIDNHAQRLHNGHVGRRQRRYRRLRSNSEAYQIALAYSRLITRLSAAEPICNNITPAIRALSRSIRLLGGSNRQRVDDAAVRDHKIA
ncbi:hypothetical protein ACJJTC_018408 [Scirpophaga incertulas]